MEHGIIGKLNTKVKQMERTFEERSWRTVASDIKDYLVPNRGRFLQSDRDSSESNRNNNDEERDLIIDDEGEQALDMLVSIFMSMLVPSNSPWMKLKINDPQYKNNQSIRIWLDDVSDLILRKFRDADMYGVMRNTFAEFISFATGCQLLDSHEIDTIVPVSFTFGEYLLLNGPTGMPDTFAHKSYFTAKQLRDKFGEDKMSRAALAELKPTGNTDKQFLVWHLIEPVANSGGIKNSADMPFNSIWWEAESETVDQKILRISGYDEFPVQAPRWNTISNDTYGKESPGMKMLMHIKMLQSVSEDYWVITKREGDPPLVGNIDQENVNSTPGGWTYGVDMQGGKPSVRPLFDGYKPDLPALLTGIEFLQAKIRDGFFNQLALIVSGTPDTKRMTATEIVARNDEKFAILGPILNRVFKEMLKPQIERTLSILERQGWFDEDGEYPIPEELIGVEFDIEFESVLARAQKAVGINELDRIVERTGMVGQVFGEQAFDAINVDELMNMYAEMAPARIVNDQQTRDEVRQMRSQQEQAMAQMAQMESAASAAKDMSGAALGKGSVLDVMAEEA